MAVINYKSNFSSITDTKICIVGMNGRGWGEDAYDMPNITNLKGFLCTLLSPSLPFYSYLVVDSKKMCGNRFKDFKTA